MGTALQDIYSAEKNGSVKNVGVVVTLIYFRALFFLKNDWF